MATTSRRHRVIYTWHTGIMEDYHTLENPDTLTWDQVAACYHDLEAPARGVGGEVPTHSRTMASSMVMLQYLWSCIDIW